MNHTYFTFSLESNKLPNLFETSGNLMNNIWNLWESNETSGSLMNNTTGNLWESNEQYHWKPLGV